MVEESTYTTSFRREPGDIYSEGEEVVLDFPLHSFPPHTTWYMILPSPSPSPRE